MTTMTSPMTSSPRPVTSSMYAPSRREPARNQVGKALAGVAGGTVTAVRFVGHFAVACVSVAVLGADTDH